MQSIIWKVNSLISTDIKCMYNLYVSFAILLDILDANIKKFLENLSDTTINLSIR
jgi:hypothetical protein